MSLQVEHLSVYYQTLKGDVQALEDATFTLADGEIMGLAGESGCGKTTLGHSLVRLAPPMRFVGGKVTLGDEELPIWDTERMNAFRFKQVSIVPQYAMNALNPTRKIGRMIKELVEARQVRFESVLPELKRRLALVKLPLEVLNMYPIELSGGMKQRMVMVISTLLNPELLVADEITSALDVASQRAVAEMLVEFRDKDCANSVLIITHDMSILYQIADSILVMYAGQLAEKAPTTTITAEPRHPYTKLLISSLPEIGVKWTEKRLTGIPGTTPLLLNPPVGCRFRERCPCARAQCTETPPWREVAPDHYVACWLEVENHAEA
jgi:peptide/nickel transport system ATP-binding protein